MKKLTLLFACFLFLNSFAQQYSQKYADLNYANDGKAYHTLDIYLPKTTKTSYPVVFHFFGSAWMSDNGKTLNSLGNALLAAGYAVVTPNYRSSSDAIFPAQSQDIKASIRFIRGNCDKYKLDTTFIGVTGESSGGHSASFLGTTNFVKTKTIDGITMDIEGSLGQYTPFSSKVHATCEWSAPTTMLVMDSCFSASKITSGFGATDAASSPASSLVGGAIQSNKARCKLADPCTYVDPKDPPFLLFHGAADNVVAYCQSELLYNALQSAGVQSEFVLVPGGGHMDTKTESTANIAKMVSFFDKVKASITDVKAPNKNTFIAYANSATNSLVLQGISGLSIERYELLEVSGKIIAQNRISNNEIGISSLKKGVYFVKLYGNDGSVYTNKFIKI